jgi:hypothetical protein
MRLPIRPRIYPKVAELVRRDESDIAMPQPTITLGKKQVQSEISRFLASESIAIDSIEPSQLLMPIREVSGKPTALKEPRLVGTADGKISQLLLTIPNYALFGHEPDSGSSGSVNPENNPLGAVYKDLFKKLEKDVNLIILTHNRAKEYVSKWLKEGEIKDKNVKLCIADDYLGFSVWAEDGYVGLQDAENTTYMVQPFSFPRYADGMVAPNIAHVTDIKAFTIPLYFQGGNILVGDDFVLIGADYPARSLRYVQKGAINNENKKQSLNEIYKLVLGLYSQNLDTKRQVISIGSSIPVLGEEKRTFWNDGKVWTEIINMGNSRDELHTVQPLFHIDMFITLLGRPNEKYRVAVGDPFLAANLIQKDMPEYKLPDFAMPEVFNDIAKTLEQQYNFEVIRIPLPLVYVDDEENLTRKWYFATANNCLVQFDRDNKTKNIIWMPTYGYQPWEVLKGTDEYIKNVYNNLGFEVRMLTNFQPFAENLGALHCIKKYLKRS